MKNRMRFSKRYYDIGDIIAWNLACSFWDWRMKALIKLPREKKGERFSIHNTTTKPTRNLKSEKWKWKKTKKIAQCSVFNAQCTYIYSFHFCAKIQLNQRMLRLDMYLYGRCTEKENMNRRDSISRFATSQLNKNRRTKNHNNNNIDTINSCFNKSSRLYYSLDVSFMGKCFDASQKHLSQKLNRIYVLCRSFFFCFYQI